jgi:hypothetical protein
MVGRRARSFNQSGLNAQQGTINKIKLLPPSRSAVQSPKSTSTAKFFRSPWPTLCMSFGSEGGGNRPEHQGTSNQDLLGPVTQGLVGFPTEHTRAEKLGGE